MAEKTDRMGLLSKMALFVRNPTKDWSELDRAEPEAESGYDKHALKAMIERKRQNDFVRRREFDQLRKLRLKEVVGVAGVARPSLFQSSVVTDQDGRAVTLKKIDEIEAQMSKQWWKGKLDPSHGGPQAAGFPVATASVGQDVHNPTFFQTTLSADPNQIAGDFTETQMGSGMEPLRSKSPSRHGEDRLDALDGGFSASTLLAADGADMMTDPELEEAAIRFANGDDSGAEKGLLLALRGEAIDPDIALLWGAALLDLYRATMNQGKFDRALAEFGLRFGDYHPTWERRPTAVVSAIPAVSNLLWDCPENLDGNAMESLRELLSTQPMPWSLGWSRLSRISSDAMPLVEGLFGSLCDEPVSLRFFGADRLVQALRVMLPAGDRSVNPAWWSARLNVLRTLQLIDEFELAALDYCVTFEVAPPAWQPARCECENLSAPAMNELPSSQSAVNAAMVPTGLDAVGGANVILTGEVLGDASMALSGLADGNARGVLITISCDTLLRVDFSAAGIILNWVALRQAEGSSVQFRNVNRLVAAFFNVIGINEHARVVPQPI